MQSTHAVMMPCSSSSPSPGFGIRSRVPFPEFHSQDGCRQDINIMPVLWNGVGGVADDFRLSCPGAPDWPDLDSDVGPGWLGILLGQDEISEDPDRRWNDVTAQSHLVPALDP